MEMFCHDIWSDCLRIIKDNVTPQSFKTWFEPIKALKLERNILTIQVPSLFFYEWLEEHYVSLLRKTIKHQLGSEGRLEYNIVMDKPSDTGEAGCSVNIPTNGNGNLKNQAVAMPISVNMPIKNPFVIPGLKKITIDSQLNPKYSFENFIQGDCNALPRNAGWAVAQKPGGTIYNPLFIYGGSGLGKTHLVQAIGTAVKTKLPEKQVLYVQAERFGQQFVESLKTHQINNFMNFYQLIDVLIIDDVQFFSGKEKMQNVFFTIFNHLHTSGKQIIMTCDKSPKDLEGLEARLLSRFKWGLSTNVLAPDKATRKAILETKMVMDGIPKLPNDVIDYVAEHIDSNIRELEGAWISLMAHSTLNRKEVDLELTKQILKNFIKHVDNKISMESIQKLVCEYFNIEPDMLKSRARKREIVQARQISMFFTKSHIKSSLKSIGQFYGGRDHSTVIYSCKTVDDLMKTDKKFKSYVSDIQKKIKIS